MKEINPSLSGSKDDFLIEMADQLRHEGFEKGMLEGLREGIELGLELRFGLTGRTMMRQVQTICDIGKLETLKNAIRHVRNPDELKSILKSL